MISRALVAGFCLAASIVARAADLQAPPPPRLPPSEAAAAVQSWVAESLGLPLAPGREAAWTTAAAQAMRSDPGASIEQVTARALASVHNLAPEAARDVEALLTGQPLDSLPGNAHGFVGAGADVYSFSKFGLHRRADGVWEKVDAPGVNVLRGFAVDGGRLIAGDGYRVFEIEGGARRTIIPSGVGSVDLVTRYEGTAYLGVSGIWNGLYAERDGRWERVPGSDAIGRPGSAVEHGGALYVGGTRGLFRFDGKAWTPLLDGNVTRVLSHGGRLYAQAYVDSGSRGFEIVDDKATPLFDGGIVDWFYPHGERLYAAYWGTRERPLAGWELHERTPAGWRRVLERVEKRGNIANAGDELFVRTSDGVHHRKADGGWNRITDSPGSRLRGDAVAHAGRFYMGTEDGLAVAGGGRIDVVVPGLVVKAMVSRGDELLLATWQGVKRLLTNVSLPPGWRDALLEAFQAAMMEAAPPVPAAPLLRDRGGRSLLGLGAPPALQGASEVWSRLERWIGRTIELGIPSSRAEAWAEQARTLLRNDPALPLDDALARSFADAHSLPLAAAERVRNVLVGRPISEHLEQTAGIATRLIPVGSRLYAFTNNGIYARDGGRWTPVEGSGNVLAHHGSAIIDGTLHVSDGSQAYAVQGDRLARVADGARLVTAGHDGRRYLGTSEGLFEKRAGAWARAEGAEGLGGVYALAALNGWLYAGTDKGLFRKDEAGWTHLLGLADQGSVSAIVEGDGALYALVNSIERLPRGARHSTWRVLEVRPPFAGPLTTPPQGVAALFRHGSRVYAEGNQRLHEMANGSWQPAFPETLDRASVQLGPDELLVSTQRASYRRQGAGPWQPLPLIKGAGQVAEHESGARYLATAAGVYRVDPAALVPLTDGHAFSVARVGDELFVGEVEGVKRMPLPVEDPPPGWREALLADLARELAERRPADGPPAPPSDVPLRDARGRSLLGLQEGR